MSVGVKRGSVELDRWRALHLPEAAWIKAFRLQQWGGERYSWQTRLKNHHRVDHFFVHFWSDVSGMLKLRWWLHLSCKPGRGFQGRLAQSPSFFFLIWWKCNTDVTDYALIEGVRLGLAFRGHVGQRSRSKCPDLRFCERGSDCESGEGRSSFVGVAGLAGLFLSTLCLQYLTSSPCLPTVTLMEPERAGTAQNLLEKHQSHLVVFEQGQRLCQECTPLGEMYTYCTNPIKTPFKWQIAKKTQTNLI